MGITDHRARQHLIAAGKLYPGAWRVLDGMRQERGKSLPDWSEWCYLPLAASYAVVSGGGDNRVPPHLAGDVGRLGALAAWRPTQGIYRFDPTLYAALTDTPLSGDLPCEVLHHLPEWCVYIETPGYEWMGSELYGFYAHLECDPEANREELRLLMDSEAALAPIPIHLGPWPLAEAVARAIDVSRTYGAALGLPVPDGIAAATSEAISPLLSLLLYLCADESEIGDGQARPTMPRPKRTKQGWRLFPADKPAQWDVGVRLGAALRRAYHQQETGRQDIDPQTGRMRPRAHVRCAHWHTYRHGEGRTLTRLRWLPPIPVNIDDPDAMPSTVRPTK
ncbi:MAG: hypothetical protein CVV05_00880 [Gammaproteobacteria bacterium HGW-Gammaproteobacteria-1]|jgi:hypothetical protein|nr:MAG: hypothetical protein CVV05_00880 [Gammaproteobacteria bacterium HGW-Gammaproteobacteria-1]